MAVIQLASISLAATTRKLYREISEDPRFHGRYRDLIALRDKIRELATRLARAGAISAAEETDAKDRVTQILTDVNNAYQDLIVSRPDDQEDVFTMELQLEGAQSELERIFRQLDALTWKLKDSVIDYVLAAVAGSGLAVLVYLLRKV